MKPLITLLLFSVAIAAANAQIVDTVNKKTITDHRLRENDLFKGKKPVNLEMIPPVIIILNYKQVISLNEYMQVKRNGDIIKEYNLKSEPGKEVEKVMIVESKNKLKYLKLGKM